MSPVRMLDRRRMAVPIRVVQEIRKRWSRLSGPPRWTGEARAAAQILSGGTLVSVATNSTVQPLVDVFRRHAELSDSTAVSPSRRLDSQQAALLAEADEIMIGNWTVFGTPFHPTHGQPEWRRHPLSGVLTPLAHFTKLGFTSDIAVGDIKFLWEINRHTELLRLAQAYALTGNEGYAERAQLLLASWLEENPPELGLNWTSALDVGFRAIAWCWLWKLTHSSVSWTDARLSRLLWTLHHSAEFMSRFDSVHHSPNTHLTGEALGLAYVGFTFPQLKSAARWQARGVQTLVDEIPHQFLADGFHFERSTGYHEYNLEFYLHAVLLMRRAEDSRWSAMVEPLDRGLRALACLRGADHRLPVLGDHDGGNCARFWSRGLATHDALLAIGSAVLDRPDLMHGVAEEATGVCAWFGLPAHPSLPDVFPPSVQLPVSGYFVASDAQERGPGPTWQCIVDAGPHGGDRTGHAHTDLGHVEIVFGKERIVCDPGSFSYADADAREFYRSLLAHATVSVDDAVLAEAKGTFGWRSVAPVPRVSVVDADSVWCCTLSYGIPDRNVTHERQVLLVRGYGVVVADFVRGSGKQHVSWRWPLATACRRDAEEMLIAGPVRISCEASSSYDIEIANASRSPGYGERVGTAIVQFRTTDSCHAFRQVTCFTPAIATPPRVEMGIDMFFVTLGQSDSEIRSTSRIGAGTAPATAVSEGLNDAPRSLGAH